MKWSSRVIALVFLLLLAGTIVLVMRPHPVDVDVAEVTRGPLEELVIDDGRARVRERYAVSAPVAGTLARIELHEGDQVEPGTVLARILPLPSPLLDPRARQVAEQRLASALDAHRQAEATVMRADAALEQAKSDLSRVESLAKSGSLPPSELEQVTADARMRTAELSSGRFAEKVAAHEIEQARAALQTFPGGTRVSEQFEVTSPVHGVVLHVLHQSEGVITPGTALVEVGDPAALELVSDILSQDAVPIRPGMPARAAHWGGGAPLAARVRRVEPSAFTKTSALGVDEQRVNVLFDLEGPKESWRALGDGFAVQMEITTWSKSDAVEVPTSALFRRGQDWAAFVVVDGRAVVRAVVPGHKGTAATEIERGLAVGERVILHPGASVREGLRVSWR